MALLAALGTAKTFRRGKEAKLSCQSVASITQSTWETELTRRVSAGAPRPGVGLRRASRAAQSPPRITNIIKIEANRETLATIYIRI